MANIGLNPLTPDAAHHTWTVLSGHVEAFIDAWESGDEPPLPRDYLPGDPPAVRCMTLVELIKIDLEYRWVHKGQRRLIEDYLADHAELSDDLPADLIYEEYHIRSRSGDDVSPADYLTRFPQRAVELQRLFGLQPANHSTSLSQGTRGRLQDIQPGERLDDFDLLTLLGKGAFASVFLARQNSMQRLVALKVSADKGTEPQTLAQLDHEHIVRVYDQRILPDRNLRLLYMQYISGGTLQAVADVVRRTPVGERTGRILLDGITESLAQRGETPSNESGLKSRLSHRAWPDVVCGLGAKLARALDHAHRHGVLHRDIKPANVLLAADGSPKLADFNIGFSSKVAGASPAAYFGGTLAYMSPEQLEACNPAHARQPDSLDGRSDLYSLAVVLWELLTGARPFSDEQLAVGWNSTLAEMTNRRRAGVDSVVAAQVSRNWLRGLRDVLLQCLEPEPEKRPATGIELARQLELCLQPVAQTLLAPPLQSWRRIARRFPVACVMFAVLFPNILAAVFNYFYNRQEIIDHLQDSREAFERIQLTVNAIAFPTGIFFVFWFLRPVVAALRKMERNQPPSAEQLADARRKCLRLGHLAAGICLALWMVAAPVYPIALQLKVGSIPVSAYIHFVASLTLCGLIAAAYPFFGVACFSVCSFYPGLVRIDSMTADDLDPLRRLGQASWLYLLLAATVPMLSVAILVIIGSQARLALGLVAVAGLAGFGVAFSLFRMLQSDLVALSLVAAPADESLEASSTLSRSF